MKQMDKPFDIIISETVSVAMVALLVIAGTVLLLRQLDRVERFLRVCAWCRKVWLDDRWIVFKEYVKKEHMLKSTAFVPNVLTS